jgi:hypothetical protein
MQVDPASTSPDFWSGVGVEFAAALFSTLGALIVALIVYRKTRDDQRAIFRDEAQEAARVRADEEKARRLAVRAGLHYEIADNLKRLEGFRSRIVLPEDGKNTAGAVASRLVDTPIRTWSTGIWQGAAASVVLAITSEQLAEAYALYSTMAEIVETQRRLQVARESDIAAYAAEPTSPPFMHGMSAQKFRSTDYFGSTAHALIPDLEREVDAILAKGNPIPIEP